VSRVLFGLRRTQGESEGFRRLALVFAVLVGVVAVCVSLVSLGAIALQVSDEEFIRGLEYMRDFYGPRGAMGRGEEVSFLEAVDRAGPLVVALYIGRVPTFLLFLVILAAGSLLSYLVALWGARVALGSVKATSGLVAWIRAGFREGS